MAALVDLDLNCCPPSPEEPRLAMLAREQPFPEQMDRHKLYGSFWKQSSAAPSSLHSTHEHKLMSLEESCNPNPYVSSSSHQRKTHSNSAEQNFDPNRSVWRKPNMFVPMKHSYHDHIDLEKPATSDDVSEIVVYSGFGNPANHIVRSQESSCCVSPENISLAETALLCRERNSFRVSPGSVGSSGTPGCQSPIKQSNTESRHSLFDLNEPQDESLHVFDTSSKEIYPTCSPCPGVFSKKSSQVLQKKVGSSAGSLEESSITVMVPNSAACSSKNVATASLVQREGLIDLNVPLESTDMPSENFSSFMLHPVSATHGINKSKVLIPGTILVDNHVCLKAGVSHDGPSNSQMDISMLGAGAESDDIVVATAAETLLSIFSHNSACTANTPERNSQISVQDGNNEPQCSLDSFEKGVLNLEEVRDDGQSIPVIPPGKDAPACGIKLKRGRGMRNFQREIIPGLVSLARQDICDDLHAIGYEPKKTRSRKARRGQGASSSRSRPRKRGTATRN
ncbi:hypothetical protein EJB05_23444 [Eragrostis curvula]|uniref:Uncharacterized protein n=1 Tax=Eragrostis curvula TaxID=38414 RepID=A0A5J9V740_9POAL|nr:hypothetical protein EJB05_23444 [Eragrostis curvula]